MYKLHYSTLNFADFLLTFLLPALYVAEIMKESKLGCYLHPEPCALNCFELLL